MQLLSARKIAKVGTASFFLSQTNVNLLVSRTWTTPLFLLIIANTRNPLIRLSANTFMEKYLKYATCTCVLSM